MSRDQYGSAGFAGGRSGQRWDSERFAMERDRARFTERDDIVARRPRERSVDEIYERRGPRGGFEEDRYHSRTVDYEEPEPQPRFMREPPRPQRGQEITIEREKEREFYRSPSPPRRAPAARPGFLRRQSSLDTFDRKPFPRYDREEYGPPARIPKEDFGSRPAAFVPVPLPVRRALPPPRRYEREYEDIRVAEPDYYGDDDYRPYPERVREREIVRTRRRSRSRSRERSVKESVRSSSSSSSEAATVKSMKSEFPKRGKTRMPARLVSKRAIIELGYAFEEEGDVIIIQKALGRENIDEVIKLSEEIKVEKIVERSPEREIVTERRVTETITRAEPEPEPYIEEEYVKKTTIERREVSPARTHHNPHIITAERTEYIERGESLPNRELMLVPAGPSGASLGRDERSIRAEIKALEAEKDAIKAERKAEREMRRAERIRRDGREESELILYDKEDIIREERTEIRHERNDRGGVRIEKDKKGPDPRALRFMLKTLT